MLLSKKLNILIVLLLKLRDQLLVLLFVILNLLKQSVLLIAHRSHNVFLSLTLSFRLFYSKVFKKCEERPSPVNVIHVSNESLLALMLNTVSPRDVALANGTCKWHLSALCFQMIFPRSLFPENSIRGTTHQAGKLRLLTLGLVRSSVGVVVLLVTQVAVHLDLD